MNLSKLCSFGFSLLWQSFRNNATSHLGFFNKLIAFQMQIYLDSHIQMLQLYNLSKYFLKISRMVFPWFVLYVYNFILLCVMIATLLVSVVVQSHGSQYLDIRMILHIHNNYVKQNNYTLR